MDIQNNIWLLTVGAAGMQSQTRGLGEYISHATQYPTIEHTHHFKYLGWLPSRSLLHLCDNANAHYKSFPDNILPRLLITCGRRSAVVSAALKIKAQNNGLKDFKNIHIQDPKLSYDYFDMIIAPYHDQILGKNIMQSEMALHHINQEKLNIARQNPHILLQNKNKPILAVLIGGSRGKINFNAIQQQHKIVDKLIRHVIDIQKHYDCRVIMTPSRRTNNVMKKRIITHIDNNPNIILWDGHGDNPYLSLLALSDAIIVTQDSASMICEAIASGKRVYVFPTENVAKKLQHMIDYLTNKNLLYDLHNNFTFVPPIHCDIGKMNETEYIAKKIVDVLGLAN